MSDLNVIKCYERSAYVETECLVPQKTRGVKERMQNDRYMECRKCHQRAMPCHAMQPDHAAKTPMIWKRREEDSVGLPPTRCQ